jgi:hypothetical protein
MFLCGESKRSSGAKSGSLEIQSYGRSSPESRLPTTRRRLAITFASSARPCCTSTAYRQAVL